VIDTLSSIKLKTYIQLPSNDGEAKDDSKQDAKCDDVFWMNGCINEIIIYDVWV